MLSRLLDNIVTNPTEEKYRKVRLSNPKIQAAVVDALGGVELLIACGFHIIFEKSTTVDSSTKNSTIQADTTTATTSDATADGIAAPSSAPQHAQQQEKESDEEGYAVLPPDADLDRLKQAVHLLRKLAPTTTARAARPPSAPLQQQQQLPSIQALNNTSAVISASQASDTSSLGILNNPRPPPPPTLQQNTRPTNKPDREWGSPIPRNTKVILPASVDTDVPSWFFERTGFELKASFASAIKRREQSQTLMTKAMRERMQRQNQGPRVEPAYATVKVRLPEGISLQGEFGPHEPVVVLFAWVADNLCDPLQTFDLVLPDRSVLQVSTKANAWNATSTNVTSAPLRGAAGAVAAAAAAAAAKRPSSVKEAGLLPSVTLNLRWTGPSATVMAGVPALRQELMIHAAS